MLFEHALVVTFLYGQTYDCNEYCKYYKNVGTERYKFIPAVHRTFNDGAVTHVTGLITISPEDYAAMPSQFDGEWLREQLSRRRRLRRALRRQDQGGVARRDHRRPPHHPDPAEPLPGAPRHEPALAARPVPPTTRSPRHR